MSKILIVEDDTQLLLSLTVRLRADGHEVVSAQDGMMAMTLAVKERPDLVILGYQPAAAPSSRQRPSNHRTAEACSSCLNSVTKRDLPTPASPISVATPQSSVSPR